MTLEQNVHVHAHDAVLGGALAIPDDPIGVVLFAHGSGSGRHSPRNQLVARALQRRGIGTLLVDLLTPDEQRLDDLTLELRFDIDLLADRLIGATHWLRVAGATGLPIGYYGASTGAAAALLAAAREPYPIAAIVSRGGRPDLAGPALEHVRAPTLLIVGGADPVVLDLNRAARAQLGAGSELEVIPRASHLFREPGALDRVATLATHWFLLHLTAAAQPSERSDDRA